MRAAEIASLLADQAENVCRLLLPNGKRDGQEWRAGSTHGEAGKSLGVRLTGDKAGTWKDFDEGAGGDLIDLWAATNGLSIGDAIVQARDYLGVRGTTFSGSSPKQYARPEKPKCTRPASRVRDWLTTTRGLSDATITAYALAEDGNSVIFPSLRKGDLIRWKARDIDDKRKMRVSPDCEPCLFGWQAIRPEARAVIICEGEIDACSWFQLGFPALSVPNGAQGTTWIESEFDNLERFDTIYLSFDNDEAGQKGAQAIIDRLGRERCRLIAIPDPHKDANDLLLGKVDVAPLMLAARTQDPEQLKPASDYADEVIAEFYPDDDEVRGFHAPWNKAAGLAFRYGEVVILAGQNGHGKSELAGHLALSAMEQGERACVASMEFKPRRWLARLTRQAGSVGVPNEALIRQVHGWYNGKLWVFDSQGHASISHMLEVFNYARRRYNVRLFVVDNLAKCGFAEDDYNGQKQFVDTLTDFARDNDAVVILCAHVRKAQDETHIGNKHDIKGSGGITDMADTVLILWRNKGKEIERRKAEDDGGEFDDGKLPDAILICDKQRNGEDEPRVSLWFDRRSHQYLEFSSQRAHRFVQFIPEAVA